jgi:hypothetical protein
MRNHPHIAKLDFAATALPRRVVHLLLLAVALAGTGTTIAALSNGTSDPARPVASAPADAAATTLLPTVLVYAEPEIPTLATITVRTGDIGSAVLERKSSAVHARFLPVHAVTSFASGSAGTGFGMPYYSFGKPLRHGTEE